MARYEPGTPVRREHLTTIAMTNGNEKHISRVIFDGQLREWVGFGWIDVDGDAILVVGDDIPEVGF